MAICAALYTYLRQKGVMWSHITYSYLSLRHEITYYFPPYMTLTFNDMPV